MSKKKQDKKQISTSQSNHKKLKKQKKLSKKIKKQVETSCASKPKTVHVTEKVRKTKKRRNKESGSTVSSKKPSQSRGMTNSAVRPGSVSSDTDPEPIEADWCLGEQDDDDVAKIESGSLSDDLEESETDEDEELDEAELNSLLLHETEEAAEVSEQTKTNQVHKIKKNKRSSEVESEPLDVAQTKQSDSNSIHVPSSDLNDESGLLKEIHNRASQINSRTLYLTPVPPNCTMEMLHRLSPTLVSCRLSYNSATKTCRKYAFLEYADNATASSAKKLLFGRLFAGATISVQFGRPQLSNEQGLDSVDLKQLFVSGLHQSVSRNDLKQVFPKAEIDYPLHAAGFPLGYAIVKFVNESVALEAFKNTHNRLLRNQPMFVNYVTKPSKLLKNTQTKPEKKFQIHVPTDPADSEASSVVKTNQCLPVEHPTPTSPSSKRAKVIVQPIVESDSEGECAGSSGNRVPSADSEEPFLSRKASQTIAKKEPTHILSQLIKSRKKPSTKDLATSLDDKSAKSNEASNSHGDSSTSDESDGNSDADSASVEDSESDSDDLDSDDEDALSNGDTAPSDEKADLSPSSSLDHSALFACPPTAEEKANLAQTNNSSDEDVDNALRSVMQARRGAMRALKTGGSKHFRTMSTNGFSSTVLKSGLAKNRKPFTLPVPKKKGKRGIQLP